MKPILCLALIFFSPHLHAGDTAAVPQFLHTLKPRHIGPANMSGRITEVAVYEKLPRIQYVASASGGLWKTINNGTTWKPVFDRAGTVALGAVAVSQTNPNIVWVGTGEANARNSVSWGDGVYKSIDGGRTWQHVGLKETHHIGRIVLHPSNPNIAYVAALGRLWGANPERGVFKTSNGGASWEKILYLDEDTGCIDLAMDPDNAFTLYAAAYQVRRDAFSGGNPAVQTGPKAGLYKTTDAGKTWQKLTQGLPQRPLGRCGISVWRKNPRVVFAVVQTDRTEVTVSGQQPNDKLNLNAGGVFRSDDGGLTWKHFNSLVPRPFYYGQIRVDPTNARQVYVLGIAFHISKDAGRTFTKANAAKGTHPDYHALWINPADPSHLVLGSDGGLNYSYDQSATWEYLKNLPVAQFYGVGVDMQKPYRVYGGLQDNGTWGAPSATRDLAGITLADWVNLLGYDGYNCQVDPTDPNVVFCEGQYGILRRIHLDTWKKYDIKPRLAAMDYDTNIVPKPPRGTPEFRFNWASPILMSPHNPKTIYFGGNVLFRSTDRGDTWTIISPDLTRGKPGPNDYRGHALTAVAESPVQAGLLYVGTDDGNLHMSQDGGRQWHNLTDLLPDVPKDRWITRLEASRHQPGGVYVAIDRHRNDDRAPYLFASHDYGKTWTSIAGNLPAEGPIHALREDPRNPDLLYVGTEFGLFISMDGGGAWHKQAHLPTVPVHDLVVHPRDHELVIATHGRGIYIMDASPLQELIPRARSHVAHLCDIRPAQAYRQVTLRKLGSKSYAGANPPYGAGFTFHVKDDPAAAPKLTVTNKQGKQVAELTGSRAKGLQRLQWDLNRPGAKADEYDPVPSGEYIVNLRVGNQIVRKVFQVETEE
ncbi:MAG: hypothetical protein L0Y71_24085 [Gemmataceae bacterium]|nr:hypothetical protein [Gemmataceae bacterium]